MSESKSHPSSSEVQRRAEDLIRGQLELKLGVRLDSPTPTGGLELDGFCDGPKPICVEMWAHQGSAKSGQKNKVLKDMCKLLLFERLLDRPCRKIVAVADENALSFLHGESWYGSFAREFGIELLCVELPQHERDRIRDAQRRQYR